MKSSILLACILVLISCSTPPGTKQQTVQASSAIDTIKPQPPQRSSRLIMDTARPKKDINATFPFDISLQDATQNKLNSAEALQANGEPVVVLFWLTTCYPCRMELRAISEQYASWKEQANFKLVAISTDFPKNFHRFVDRVEKAQWPFPALHDENREFRQVLPGGLNGLPQTFIFNGKGEIVYHKRKYSTNDELKILEMLKELSPI